MTIAVFPDDFEERAHPIAQDMNFSAWQWRLLDATGECMVSVVGGEPYRSRENVFNLFHGDGVNTFEMWDMLHADDPRPWLTKEEINAYLAENKIEVPEKPTP